MPYTPLEWKDGPEGGTPISAANLNRMEQGIKAAHDLAESKAEADSFQLSGNVPVELTISGNGSANQQQIRVTIPAGKKLVLKKARWSFQGPSGDDPIPIRLRVLMFSTWVSPSDRGESDPNIVMYDNSASETDAVAIRMYVTVYNSSGSSFTLPRGGGWWLLFAFE